MVYNLTTLEGQFVKKAYNETYYNVCFTLPPLANFASFPIPLGSQSNQFTTLLEFQIAIIFVITEATYHCLLKFFGLPKITSQLIAGLLLGPSIKGKLGRSQESIFPVMSQDIIGTVSMFGYSLFLFVIAVKMDVSMIRRTGVKALAIGVLSLLVPLVFGLFTLTIGLHIFGMAWSKETLFVALTPALTSFAVVASMLEDLNILNSEVGRLGLSSALITDVVSAFVTSTFNIVRFFFATSANGTKIATNTGFSLAYVFAAVFIFRPAMFWIISKTPAGRPVRDVYLYPIVLLVFFTGILSDHFDQTVHFGPFVLGLVVPSGQPLGSSLVNKLECLGLGLFLPLYITLCAIQADLSHIIDNDKVLFLDIALIAATFVGKILSTMVPCLICKMPLNDALTMGFIMSSKGIVNLANYSVFYDEGLIDTQTYTLLVISVLITATLVCCTVKYLYDPSRKYAGYQKRNIIDLKPNAELRILACIHSPYDVPPIINLLDVSCPTGGTPIFFNALHLIELIGRSSPIFIDHQTHDHVPPELSYSENIILPFSQYQLSNRGAAVVNMYTSISPSSSMHEDICTLALDKLVSLLILPFHQKISSEGSVECEDNTRRTINLGVIGRAPCSVGIIVHRSHVRHPSSLYRVAMIFIGGGDDREALTFAKRVFRDPKSFSLTVIRLDPGRNDKTLSDWEKVLDNEVLKDVKYTDGGNKNVRYTEEKAKDASQTAQVLRSSLRDEYELIIVGRRNGSESPQTLGLAEWIEYPELGVIGDMLTSSDFECGASVFVVQQQQQLT